MIKNLLPEQIKAPIRKWPIIRTYLHKKHIKKEYQTEIQLIENRHLNKCKKQSIIHFSFNKAASQYVKTILRQCAHEIGMQPVGLLEYAFHSNFPYLYWLNASEMKKYKHVFKTTGYVYTAFSEMIQGVEALKDFKIIYMTRDPRDILVSSYYSIAYSHAVPPVKNNKQKRFLKQREEALNSSIDEYVLKKADGWLKLFNKYNTLLLEKYNNVYITDYADMVNDFETWLTDLLNYTELNISENLKELIIKKHRENIPVRENKHKHMRKGQPGDYNNKLKPETIKQLNNKFKDIIKQFNYPV